jgi:hypothetical protein
MGDEFFTGLVDADLVQERYKSMACMFFEIPAK